MMNWLPNYEKLIHTAPIVIDIAEPPCKNCGKWSPKLRQDNKGNFNGVIFCTADTMYSDFSCYKDRPKQKDKISPCMDHDVPAHPCSICDQKCDSSVEQIKLPHYEVKDTPDCDRGVTKEKCSKCPLEGNKACIYTRKPIVPHDERGWQPK